MHFHVRRLLIGNYGNGKCIFKKIVLEGSPPNTIFLHDLEYVQ